ncbi:MAG: flagellar biosynthetic protein FliQ, partial [Planctomycetes bacterium]|nr:flagellar biosynthetic protein FliQ [Planctomycetota bacterium]
SLLQTLTQLQDQTVSIVPKIVAMLLAAMYFIPWLAGRMIEFTQKMFTSL